MTYHSYIEELNQMSFEELKSRFLQITINEPMSELDEIALRIASFGCEGEMFLLDVIEESDQFHTGAILSGFPYFKQHKEKIKPILQHYLHDNRLNLVAEAIESMNRIGYAEFVDDIAPLKDHENPFVAGAALRFLSRHYPDIARPALLNALHSDDPIIIQNGIDELEDLQAVDAIADILPLIDHPHPDVRLAATTAVDNLTKILDSEEE